MKFQNFVLERLGHPRGLLAPLFSFVFNRNNRALIDSAIAALDASPTDRLLDVGFGGGVSLPKLLGLARDGHVTGVDISDEMLAAARGRHARELDAGKLTLAKCGVEGLALESASVDGAISCNTYYFWPDVDAGLRELARVLAPGGTLVLANRRVAELTALGFTHARHNLHEDEVVVQKLGLAGFATVDCVEPRDRYDSVLFVARRPL